MEPDRIEENDQERREETRREQIRIVNSGEPRQEFEADRGVNPELVMLEDEIEEIRLASRVMIMLGTFLLIFAGFWMIYVGWDIRGGRGFTPAMVLISAVVGVALIIAGAMTRRRQRVLHEDRRHSGRNRAA